MDLFRNQFVQAIGVAAVTYLILRGIGLGLGWILLGIESFSRWYRYVALPASEELAIALGVAYLIGMAVFSSKRN